MEFLHKFFKSASGKNYLYDAVTNRVFQISDLLYKHHTVLFESLENKLNLLKLYKDAAYGDILKEFAKLENAFHKGLISPNNISGVDYPFTIAELENRLNTSLRHMVLCITENCNLRCEYCIYSGHYLHSRKHSVKVMPYSNAKKAIEFLHEHSAESSKIIVGFYGGEPLTEFEKIKKLIAYCQSVFTGKEQHYQIASNGTLINDDFINWFACNPDVSLNITLNGQETFHDRYRHTQGGSGSHYAILKAVSKILERNSEAYHKRVNFICNYLHTSDIPGIIEFYETEKLLQGKMPIMLSGVYDADHDGFISELIDEASASSRTLIGKSSFDELVEMYGNTVSFNQPLFKLLFDNPLYVINNRRVLPTGGNGFFTGVCVPFASTFFVRADGTINLCEKLSDYFDFGNINDGFNLDKVRQLLSDYKIANEEKCKSCWAIRLCSACFVDTFAGDAVDTVHRDMMCDKIRNNLLSGFSLYYSIIEKSPSSLDFLDEYASDI